MLRERVAIQAKCCRLPSVRAHLAWCDASGLTELILDRGPNFWVQGRVHRVSDYRVGRTRIVCNPRGHVDEASGFVPDKVVALA